MARNRDQWLALVNAIINVRVPQTNNFLVAEQLSAFNERLHSLAVVVIIIIIVVPIKTVIIIIIIHSGHYFNSYSSALCFFLISLGGVRLSPLGMSATVGL
jgi:hypothetical protein